MRKLFSNVLFVLVGFSLGFLVRSEIEYFNTLQDELAISPETVVHGKIATTTDHDAKSYFSRLVEEHPELKASGPLATRLRFLGDVPMRPNQKVGLDNGVLANLTQWAGSIGDLTVVWTANEIQIAKGEELPPRDRLKTSKALLYASLCVQNPTEFPFGNELLSAEQEVELFEKLYEYKIDYETFDDLPSICEIEGSIYNLAKVKVEIASLFNSTRNGTTTETSSSK